MLKSNLADQIYDILRERIISLQFKLGEKIDIQKLAEEFGTSPTPIRDALNRLAENGLVNIKPRVGYYVIDLSAEDIAEIYDLRKMFECYALEPAMENVNFNELRQLKKEMEKIQKEADEEKRDAKFHETDRKLHLLIIKSFPNKRLQSLFSQVYDLVRLSISMGVEWEKSLKEHIALIDALEKKEFSRAKKILKDHIDSSRDDAIKAFERRFYTHNNKVNKTPLSLEK